MKKFLLLFTAVALSVVGFSQFSIGVQATGALNTALVKSEYDIDYTKKMKPGQGAGVVLEYHFNEKIGIRSGVSFTQHGSDLEVLWEVENDMKTRLEATLNYLQIPVTVTYSFPAQNSRFFVGAGGYVGYGVGGKLKATLSSLDGEGQEMVFIEELKAFKKTEDGGGNFKKGDVGITAIAGVEFKSGWFVNAGYQFGLSNINMDEDPGNKYNNRGLHLTVGYFFKRK